MDHRVACLCPKCATRYRVLAEAVGHHVRCRACGTRFRVAETLSGPPTDDDILRWLREAEERDEAARDAADAAADQADLDATGVGEYANPLSTASIERDQLRHRDTSPQIQT